LLIVLFFWNSLPEPLFTDSYSTVVFDRDNKLLGARISNDGQWRFPMPDSIPEKFSTCILEFEDRHFYHHPGVNPASLARAAYQNLKSGEIVSGGSTLSMQVIRLSRKGKPRTIVEKLIEIVLAMRLELSYSKNEILELYSTHAPFGGNVVGLETAAWRYFERDPFNLSWAESALLAVLPNAPSLMHPGKNREMLKKKRDGLLKRLNDQGVIDSITYVLSIEEKIPENPGILPDIAYHLTERFNIYNKGARIRSTVERDLQEQVHYTINSTHKNLNYAGIHNAACLVVEVETGNVIAYKGNIRNTLHPEFGGDVDMIRSARSSGSILKPLLYILMQQNGEILPETLIPDIPTRYNNYSPKNFNRSYEGSVKASRALAQSLNVPAVRMLHSYGHERFLHDLRKMGFSSMNKPADHYGLSLILGGAECSPEDLASVYASIARVLNHYTRSEGYYYRSDWHSVKLRKPDSESEQMLTQYPGEEQGQLGAGAIWLGLKALVEVNRPEELEGWELFSSSRKVAWKTGTSFGFRDGWAVAITPEYVVVVWTGNANGEGRPGISGMQSAAPILFRVLNLLPETTWFGTPFDDLAEVAVCEESGFKASKYCPSKDTILVSPAGKNKAPCPYHKLVHLDKNEKFRVHSGCYDVSEIISQPWFVLPPAQEWFYKIKDPGYKILPPLLPSCKGYESIEQIQLLYPVPASVIYIPYELDGEKGNVVFEATHRDPDSEIFWSIDEKFIAKTRTFHKISVRPEEGRHTLTLTDKSGNTKSISFDVIDR